MVRKILRPVSAMPPQPNGAVQNYSISRPDYRNERFFDTKNTVGIRSTYWHLICAESKIEKVPRGNRGEKSSEDMASSRNLAISTIGAQSSPTMGDGTSSPEG